MESATVEGEVEVVVLEEDDEDSRDNACVDVSSDARSEESWVRREVWRRWSCWS